MKGLGVPCIYKNNKIMKIFKTTLLLFALGCVFAACSDTNDCLCEVEIAKKSLNTKSTSLVPIWDNDKDCNQITIDDLKESNPNAVDLSNPCSKQ